MSLNWVAQQIAARQPGGLNLEVPRYNPRPAGVMQEGAAKEVLELLRAHPARWITFSQIKAGTTNRTQKSLEWACIYLRAMGYIECSRDEARNARYLRYRFKQDKKE